MANLALMISIVLVFALLLLSSTFIESTASMKNGAVQQQPDEGDCAGKWCVEKDQTSEESLQKNIDYCCSTPGVSCQTIWDGQPCHDPDTTAFHGSVVMNLYYKSRLCVDWACDFYGTGTVTFQDPSLGSCIFQ